jgi:hypothetical protein
MLGVRMTALGDPEAIELHEDVGLRKDDLAMDRLRRLCLSTPLPLPLTLFSHLKNPRGSGARSRWRLRPASWSRLSIAYRFGQAFEISVVAGSFAAVILGGYGIAQLIASAL